MTTTVIIPLYNKCSTILIALNSLLKQEILPNEVIIIDDCSTDGSYEILLSFLQTQSIINSNLSFIKVFRNRINSGPGKTRNYGIELSKGDLIFFLDADDSYESNYISNVKNFIEENSQIKILITPIREGSNSIIRPNINKLIAKKHIIKDNNILYTNDFVGAFCTDPIFCGCGNVVVVKKTLGTFRFSEKEFNYEDWLFYYEICKSIELSGNRVFFLDGIIGLNYNSEDFNSLSRKNINTAFINPPAFILNNKIDYRFSKYVYYNWLYSSIKRMKNRKDRIQFFKNQFNNFRNFYPPIYKFLFPIILMLFNLDEIVIRISNLRKKIKYA